MTDKIKFLSEKEVTLVHDVAKSLCKAKGYTSTPSRGNVDIVLKAIVLINEASKKVGVKKDGKGLNRQRAKE